MAASPANTKSLLSEPTPSGVSLDSHTLSLGTRSLSGVSWLLPKETPPG